MEKVSYIFVSVVFIIRPEKGDVKSEIFKNLLSIGRLKASSNPLVKTCIWDPTGNSRTRPEYFALVKPYLIFTFKVLLKKRICIF